MIPVLANLYIFIKLAPLYVTIEHQDVAGSYRNFADNVEANDLSNKEISNRLKNMAVGQEKIQVGLAKIRVGAYFCLLSVFLIALLQGILISKLLRIHNKVIKNRQ